MRRLSPRTTALVTLLAPVPAVEAHRHETPGAPSRPLALEYPIVATILALAAIVVAPVVWQTPASWLGAALQRHGATEAVTLSVLDGLGRRNLLTWERGVLRLRIDGTLAGPHILRVVVADHTGLIVGATGAARAAAARLALAGGLPVALAGVALLAVVGLVIGHLVTRRPEGLGQASRRRATGELGVRAGLGGADEIVQLGADSDRMAAQLERQVAELRLVQSAVEEIQGQRPLAARLPLLVKPSGRDELADRIREAIGPGAGAG